MQDKRLDFVVVVALLALGALIGLHFNLGNIILGFLYLGVPSFYLLWRKKESYQKIGWGLLLFGVCFGSVFDFLGTVNNAWVVNRVIAPQLVVGTWPIENIIGYLWMTLFILVFYEHFLDKNTRRLSKRHSKLFAASIIVAGLVFVTYVVNPIALKFSHFYLITGLVAIAFPVFVIFNNPKIIGKFAALAFFFFFVWLVLELVGVHNSNWIFPVQGEFLGSVSLLGVSFTFEEVLFWFLWYPAVIVAYYEYFIDDQR